ncbi:VOC family protein [Granulicella aggregans]|uniref:VOC family protein n=1 Tax=Granulicella aggregans TaxID=474949 RepID=UPI0021E00052|nr:VOC family protein [Granulicella aggregans]
MLRLTPFLLFDGNCAEAMEFYFGCFGGTLTLTRLADTPMKDQMPAAQHHKIVNAYLKSDAIEFSATDWLHPTHVRLQGNSTAMYVVAARFDELKRLFDRLSEGADKEFFLDLCEMPFGIYGRFTGRFGVEWFFRGERGAD